MGTSRRKFAFLRTFATSFRIARDAIGAPEPLVPLIGSGNGFHAQPGPGARARARAARQTPPRDNPARVPAPLPDARPRVDAAALRRADRARVALDGRSIAEEPAGRVGVPGDPLR